MSRASAPLWRPTEPPAPPEIAFRRAGGDLRAGWVWLSLIPLGLGAWAPLYAGVRARSRRWCALGAAWSAITLAGWIVSVASPSSALGGFLIILGWAGAIASSFALRASYQQLVVGSSFDAAVIGGEERLRERERARRLARDRPALAQEIGIGRPDLPNAQDAGLIDINNAPAAVLAGLPGVDDMLASKIVEARQGTSGFSSIEDLGLALDLDGNLVDGMRDRAVFLPNR
jgi:Helix-hairpin-helix motif